MDINQIKLDNNFDQLSYRLYGPLIKALKK